MATDIRERLAVDDLFLLDGGTVTEQYGRGVAVVDRPAIVSNPGIVREVHDAYISVGVDILTTDTFCTNRYMLRRKGHLENLMERYTLNTTRIQIAARGDPPHV